MTRLPQVLVNVRVAPGIDVEHPPVQEVVRQVGAELGDRGRVVVRSSGTEPLVRVMVEAPTRSRGGDRRRPGASALEAG